MLAAYRILYTKGEAERSIMVVHALMLNYGRAFDVVLPGGIRLVLLCLILSGKDIVGAVALLFVA